MADINLITYKVLEEYDSDGDGVIDAKKIKVYYDNEDILYECGVPLSMTDSEIKEFLLQKLSNWGY